MTDRPIIFSAPMVRALLAGRKTQTRRLAWEKRTKRAAETGLATTSTLASAWQRVKPGAILWVRESLDRRGLEGVGYAADGGAHPDAIWIWQRDSIPSIHMPRWASRISLTVTDARRQPLQEITEEDARAEGISWSDEYEGYHTEECRHYHGAWPSRSFSSLWRSLHGEDAWDANPEIVALTFTAAQRNIDAPSAGARVA